MCWRTTAGPAERHHLNPKCSIWNWPCALLHTSPQLHSLGFFECLEQNTRHTHTLNYISFKTQQLVVRFFMLKECKNITPYLQEVNVQEGNHSQQTSKEQLPYHKSKSHSPSLMEGKKVQINKRRKFWVSQRMRLLRISLTPEQHCFEYARCISFAWCANWWNLGLQVVFLPLKRCFSL